MNSIKTSGSAYSDSKAHYEILDGLRGVAAVVVVLFHFFETFSGGNHLKQIINHGYLAVDFFFVLSGFVIGYAYDDRWKQMSLKSFFKRRLIRLQPMIVMGMLIGAAGFYLSASPVVFPKISEIPLWQMLLVMLIGCTLLPLPTSMDIRGWGEMHPLNGPAWSLFFEYIGNLLYALFIRKFSKRTLSVLVILAGAALLHLAVTSPNGDIVGGWSFNVPQLRIGITRLMYPFFAGLLLSRVCKPRKIKNAFGWCSFLIILILVMPRIGGNEYLWLNGLYDAGAILFLFPLIVFVGASGYIKGTRTAKTCKFLGDISYPLYITHYPLIYIFTAWVVDNKIPLQKAWPLAFLLLAIAVFIAYLCLKLYDLPLRKWLAKHFMKKTIISA